jgi:hypothetical protein
MDNRGDQRTPAPAFAPLMTTDSYSLTASQSCSQVSRRPEDMRVIFDSVFREKLLAEF